MNKTLEKAIDTVIATLFVLAILKYFPIFFTLDMFDPIQNTLEEMQISDLVFSQVRDESLIGMDSNIVLINNGHLNRAEFAAMLNIIDSYSPKVIAVDAFFRKEKGEHLDIPLQNACQSIDNIILASELYSPNASGSYDSVKYSNPMFADYADPGYVNMFIHPNDFRIVRLMTPTQKLRDSTVLSFAVTVAGVFNPKKAKEFLARGNELEVINFKRNIGKYKTYDFTDIFEIHENSDDLDYLKDKIVLIGYLGPDLNTKVTEDVFYTPLNEHYVGKTEPDMYGMVIHANSISMILDGDFIARIPDWLSYVLMVAIVLFNMIAFRFFRDNYSGAYQAFTISLIISEIIFFTFLILFLFHTLNLELRFAGAFFAFLVCVLSFEIYNDSIKRLARDRYREFVFDRKRKKAQTEKKATEIKS